MTHPTAPGVGLAFVIAVAAALVLMPLAVAAGRRLGFEVRPRLHGRGGPRVSYLGGAALALATCVAVVAAGDLRRDGPLLAGGLALLGLGLLDDRLGPAGLGRGVRIVAEACVAFAVWWTALRPHTAGGAFEGFLTVAGLVAAVNAFNLLDNMDGVCGATATAIALGLAALGLLAGRPGLSVLAAAAAGASLGFLRYNFGRARLYLGNGGATFLGLILGVSAFRSGLAFGPGWGPLAALAILALPATDTAVVTLSRWLAARPVGKGGTDHLSHRLVRLRLSTAGAAAVHGAAALAASGGVALAVKLGHRPILGVLAAFGVAGAGMLAVRGYDDATPHRVRHLALGATAALACGALAGVPSVLSAASALREARSQFASGVAAARGLDLPRAERAFARAGQRSAQAQRALGSPLTAVASVLPVLANNLSAARSLASGAGSMAEAAREALAAGDLFPKGPDGPHFGLVQDQIPAAPWQEAQQHLSRSVQLADLALSGVRSNGGQLVGRVALARRQFLQEGQRVLGTLQQARDAVSLVPEIFGTDGPHTWFLAIENPVEARATGGFLGAFGILKADGGRLSIARFDSDLGLPAVARPPAASAEFMARYDRFDARAMWQNVNMTPDFPTAASLMAGMWQQATGTRVDGVISLDAQALDELLRLVGPVTVTGGETISADNFLPVALNQAYVRFPQKQQRVSYLLDVARVVWSRISAGHVGKLGAVAGSLGRAIRGKHLLVWIPGREALLGRLGVAGGLDPQRGTDYLLVVGQNAAGNKVDYYAERSIDYTVQIGSDGLLRSSLGIRLTNAVPASVTAPFIVGPYLPTDPVGLNRSYVSVYMPRTSGIVSARVGGASVGMESETEAGLSVASRFLEVLPGQSSTLNVATSGTVPTSGEYRLVVQRQPTLNPDRFRLEVVLPVGASPVGPLPVGAKANGRVVGWSGLLDADRVFTIRYEGPGRQWWRMGIAAIWQKLGL
jgi:UDP-N-acetylmuramyl pentapeptide phosphotransferase/UDP-N-acetylglucosamine-1-phosphate transferase